MGQALRVGIVGVGQVALERHVPAVREAGGEVVAFADAVKGRAGRYAAQLGVPHAFDDYRALIALSDVDIVTICTPPGPHAEIAVAALQAGKAVYLDKPPAMSEAEIARVVATARQTGSLLMSGSNSIFHNEIQALKRRMDQGELGDVYLVECLKRFRRSVMRGWIRERRFGGGIVMNTCCHRIDQVLYLLGTPQVVAVTARTYDKFAAYPARSGYLPMDVAEGIMPETPVADVEDTVTAFIQFDTGCTFVLRDAYFANLPEEWRCNLYGTKGGAVLSPSYQRTDVAPLMLYSEDPDGIQTDTRPVIPPGPKSDMTQAYQHLFECLREGKQTLNPGERSVVLMRIVDAIHRSAQMGGQEIRF